jgi:hypothetical protein
MGPRGFVGVLLFGGVCVCVVGDVARECAGDNLFLCCVTQFCSRPCALMCCLMYCRMSMLSSMSLNTHNRETHKSSGELTVLFGKREDKRVVLSYFLCDFCGRQSKTKFDFNCAVKVSSTCC